MGNVLGEEVLSTRFYSFKTVRAYPEGLFECVIRFFVVRSLLRFLLRNAWLVDKMNNLKILSHHM